MSGAGTIVAALAGLLAAPVAGSQLTLLALTTGLAVGAGAEAHARLHSRLARGRSSPLDGYWIGPALTALAGALLSGRMEAGIGRIVPIIGAAIVGVLLVAQHRELDGNREGRWLPLTYALVLYVVAFALFALIYSGRDIVFLAAVGNGLCAALLAAALFRPTGATRGRLWLLAALTGLCVGELTLVLGTWITAGLLGGAFLLLFFYVTAGLLHGVLDRSLDRRLAAEYALVGIVGIALILATGPWRT